MHYRAAGNMSPSGKAIRVALAIVHGLASNFEPQMCITTSKPKAIRIHTSITQKAQSKKAPQQTGKPFVVRGRLEWLLKSHSTLPWPDNRQLDSLVHKNAALGRRITKCDFTDSEITGLPRVFQVKLLVVVLLGPKQLRALPLLLCVL